MAQVDQTKPALIGGLVVGVLSVIPIISSANCCFCLWALVGGALAAKMVIDRSSQPVTAGEGAKVALMAGIVGGVIYFLGTIILNLTAVTGLLTLKMFEAVGRISNNPQVQEVMQRTMEQMQNQTLAQRLLGTIPIAFGGGVVLMGFTVLGGLLGVALFEKRKGQAPPPPTPYTPQTPPGYPPTYPPTGTPPEGDQPGTGQ